MEMPGSGKIPAMHRHRLLSALCLSVSLGTAGCLNRNDSQPTGNVLSLDLGGNHPSLAAELRRTPPAAQPRPEPAPAVAPQPAKIKPPVRQTRVPPRPEYVVVYIAEGQTLYGLCKSNLGNGNRWREIARFNGWSDEKADRLRVGQAVKLPLR